MLTPEQIAERVHFVGASEAAAVLDLDDFKSPLEVYRAKVEGEAFGGNVFTEIGDALEPVTLRRYAAEMGVVVLPSPGTIRHAKYPMVAATPDGLVSKRVGIECKAVVTPRSRAKWFGDFGEPAIPDAYFVQCQMQCEVCDFDFVHLATLIDGQLEVRVVERDCELGAMWAEQIAGWWTRHVVPRDPPEPRDSAERADFVSRLFKKSRGHMLPATPEDAELARQLAKLKAHAKDIETRALDIETTLKARIGDADGIEGIATWKTDANGRADWKAIAMSKKPTAAEIAAYTKEPGRRFLLKTKEIE